ncbi:MAG: hypothetical protein ACJA0H_002146 [Francisellaceae bacterium]|jgi:hypothetical protein
MRNVVLHVGTPKTGSSFIQRVLKNNTDELAKINCVYFTEGQNNNRKLTSELKAKESIEEITDHFQKFLDNILGEETIILSDESFANCKSNIIEGMGVVKGYDILIVMYVRSPASFAESAYKQWFFKNEKFQNFNDFLTKWFHPRWHRNALLWKTSGHKVRVLPYTPLYKGILTQFTDIIGQVDFDINQVEEDSWGSNPSLNDVGTQIAENLQNKYKVDNHKIQNFLKNYAFDSCFTKNIGQFSLMTKPMVSEYNETNFSILDSLKDNFDFNETEMLLKHDQESSYEKSKQNLNETLIELLANCITKI